MNESHRKVSNWLTKVFGEERVPPYEINERTLHILDELRKRNEEQDRLTLAVIADYKQKSEEYRAEEKRIDDVLSKMKLSTDSVGQACSLYLNTLAQTALTLETADASNTSLLLAMTEMAQKKLQLEEQCRQEQRLYNQLLSKTKHAMQQSNRLRKALESIENQSTQQESDLQKKSKQASFLASKAREYKKHIQSLELDLTHSQAEPSVYHSTLLNKSEDLSKLKEQLKPLKAKLQSYHQLPPDLSLATVKVEETRRELAHLEEELSRHINMMHL